MLSPGALAASEEPHRGRFISAGWAGRVSPASRRSQVQWNTTGHWERYREEFSGGWGSCGSCGERGFQTALCGGSRM